MGMSPSEMLDFFREQIDIFSLGLNESIKNKNYYHAVDCLNEKLKSALMSGLIQWRHEIDSPIKNLDKCISFSQEAYEILPSMDKNATHWKNFNFCIPIFVSILLGKKADGDFRKMILDLAEWRSAANQHSNTILETALIIKFEKLTNPAEWDDIIKHLSKRKRMTLMRESFENYMLLIDAAHKGDSETMNERVHAGIKLFEKRDKDGFYSGGLPIYGGGPDNEHVVDFILASIVQHCRVKYKNSSNVTVNSIHLWNY